MVTASKRAWLSTDRARLVSDGDEAAVALFARAGQQRKEKDLARFENADEFFPGLAEKSEPAEPEPSVTSKKPKGKK